jgi:hypothetical protein
MRSREFAFLAAIATIVRSPICLRNTRLVMAELAPAIPFPNRHSGSGYRASTRASIGYGALDPDCLLAQAFADRGRIRHEPRRAATGRRAGA